MVLLIGAREAARYRLGAAGDEVGARAGLDGVVAGVVVVAELGVVLAEGLGDPARDRLGVARDLVPEAAVDVDIVVAGRAVTEDCLVVGVGDGRVAGTRLRIARDDVVAPAGQDLIVAGRALVLALVVGVQIGRAAFRERGCQDVDNPV